MAGTPENLFTSDRFDKRPNHEPEPHERWDFELLQNRVKEIYDAHDIECGYGPDTMMTKILSNAFTLRRTIERNPENTGAIELSLTNVFIWTATAANYGKLNLNEVITEKYAAGCPRCGQMPCNLAHDKPCIKDDSASQRNIPDTIPIFIDEWQVHFSHLYPNNFRGESIVALTNTSRRLLDEIIELITSADPATQKEVASLSNNDTSDSILSPWRGEFADVLAWGFAVAKALTRKTGNFSLAESLRKNYEKGCPYCGGTRCVCGKDSTILEELHERNPL